MRNFFGLWLLNFLTSVCFAQFSSHFLPDFQAEVGLHYAYAFTNNWAVEVKPNQNVRYYREERNNFGVSTFGRVASSTALAFFRFRANEAFRFGDWFVVETCLGYRRQQIEKTNHLLLGYNFSLGVVANYLIDKNNEVGLVIVPLKFTSDKVAPNVSGSYIGVRYGSRNICFSANYESRSLSFFGWVIPSTINPSQFTLEVILKCKYGFRAEWAAVRYRDNIYGGHYHNSFPTASIFLCGMF
jgi:hypothetical protein